MRNEFPLLCQECGYLSVDYLNKETKYICPYCHNEHLEEIKELTSENYDNFIYRQGYLRYNRVHERQCKIRRTFMKNPDNYHEETLHVLKENYEKNTPKNEQIKQTKVITDPITKAAIEKEEEYQKKIERIQKETEKKYFESLEKQKSSNTKHCPVCDSTYIETISTTKKIVHGMAFGLFSKTAKSQFICKSCGYKF